jgi:1,2-diacylglycerol 3-beta-glucosyltransferase
MRTMRSVHVAHAAVATAATVNVAIGGYIALLTVAGARMPRRSSAGDGTTRFVIMVPAHDEAAVIGDTLAAFGELRYPRDRFEVHVVADNCTDDTADLVRGAGWNVHERHDLAEPGKGPALNWLFDRLDTECAPGTGFDVAVIVDADSVLDPDFLIAMDHAFAGGATAAQGYYAVRDPAGSPASAVRYAALACRHHLRSLGRRRIGGSCGLYGNGMAFRRDLLRRHRWSGHLVEDAEFQIELLLRDGIRVDYVPAARLEAEMPTTLEAATSQNERWERGRIEIARRYLPELVRALPRTRQRAAVADSIADQLLPPLSAVVLAQGTGLALSAGVVAASRGRDGRRPLIIHVATIGVLVAHVAIGLRSVSAPREVYRSLAQAPRTIAGMIAWKGALWIKAMRSRGEVTWRRTQRNSEP